MKYILPVFFLLFSVVPAASIAQQRDDEERKEAQIEKKSANKDRVDNNVFRRQILTLPEFSDQRKKIAELRNQGKGIAKIYAVVDSLNENADEKFLIGYIQLSLGDNSVNVYEITYDRKLKNIILIKPTGETLEVEKEEKDEKATPKKTTSKPVPKKAAPKKKKTDEEGDEEEDEEEKDEEEEKPTKRKQKDEDD